MNRSIPSFNKITLENLSPDQIIVKQEKACVVKLGFSSGHVVVQCKDKGSRRAAVIYFQSINSKEEGESFIQKYGQTTQGYGLLAPLLFPLRVKGRDFAKDLLCPIVANCALQVDNLLLRIGAISLAILVDAATFIPRLIATPFRALYLKRHPESPHPLAELLKQNPRSAAALKLGRVTIKVCVKSINKSDAPDASAYPLVKKKETKELNIALKRVFIHKSSKKQSHQSYKGIPGDWHLSDSYARKHTSLSG